MLAARHKSKFRSAIAEAMHETARGMQRVGLIDKTTMREFDLSCLTNIEELAPQDITAIREKAGVSQAVFANVLNVTTSLVSKWERGEKHPSGASLKLLSLVKTKGLDAIL
jgi:putative transcriptional regulator